MSTSSPKPAHNDNGASKKTTSKSSSRPRSKALKNSSRGMGGLSMSTIALFTIAAVVAVGIVGYTGWKVWDSTRPFGEQRAQQIDGVVNYRAKDVDWLTNRHVDGVQKYKTSPPVGGDHNSAWQNCEGDIYAEEIAKEHAVHSLEHGAVWVTYNPDLPAADVQKLREKVQGRDYTLMSPYPGLDSPISLQSWGFMLKIDDIDDPRIDKFLKAFRKKSNVERGATCSGGITATGSEPQAPQPQQQQMPSQ